MLTTATAENTPTDKPITTLLHAAESKPFLKMHCLYLFID
jgi:hypothetical protein